MPQTNSIESQDSPIIFKGIRASGELRGLILEMKVEQYFFHTGNENYEVLYHFPLPYGAVMLGMDVQFGQRRLTSAVYLNAEARYEEAIADGDRSIVLDKEGCERGYKLQIGNWIGKEECIITLRYAQIVQINQDSLRLTIPTVLAPQSRIDPWESTINTHQIPPHDLLAEYPFDMSVRLHGEFSRAHVTSPSHAITAILESTTDDVLTISSTRSAKLDRDFVLILDKLVTKSKAIWAPNCVDTKKVAILASFNPQGLPQRESDVNLNILIDCTTYMAGDSLTSAKQALQYILSELNEDDYFLLTKFGGAVSHFKDFSPATEPERHEAGDWVNALQADEPGGYIGLAFESAFKRNSAGDVIILIGNSTTTYTLGFDVETALASGNRMFVIGIGSSGPDEPYLHHLTKVTQGTWISLYPGEPVEPVISRLLNQLRTPRITKLAVVWPEADEQISNLEISQIAADQILVHALLDKKPSGKLSLVGNRSLGMDALEVLDSANFAADPEEGETSSRMVAALRMQSIQLLKEIEYDRYSAGERQIAVDYQLLSDQTSFLLIDRQNELGLFLEIGMPLLYQVKQMLPAGWSAIGTVIKVDHKSPVLNPTLCLGSPPDTQTVVWGSDHLEQDIHEPASMETKPDRNSTLLRPELYLDSQPDPLIMAENQEWSNDYLNQVVHEPASTLTTPAKLAAWLKNHPSYLPRTYVKLHVIGLPIGVVDWLEQTIGTRRDLSTSEQEVVEAFIYVILRRYSPPPKSIFIRWLMGMFGNNSKQQKMSVNDRLVEEITAALDRLEDNAWPEKMLSFIAFKELGERQAHIINPP